MGIRFHGDGLELNVGEKRILIVIDIMKIVIDVSIGRKKKIGVSVI